jgi:hypothetical protein
VYSRPPCPCARPSRALAGVSLWAALIALTSAPAAQDDGVPEVDPERAEDAARAAALPPLEPAGEAYETPRAGDGFWTRLFGKEVHVFPEDRRSVTAYDLGLTYTRGVSDFELLPHGSAFFWRRPDEDHFLRAELVHAPDMVVVAAGAGRPLEPVAQVFFALGAALRLDWMEREISGVRAVSRMERWALQALREDAYRARRELAHCALSEAEDASPEEAVERFLAAREGRAHRLASFLRALAREGEPDLAGLTLAVRQLRSLVG